MSVLEPRSNHLKIEAQRGRVCLRTGAALDLLALTELEDEAVTLLQRGFEEVAVDLREVRIVDPTTPATLAALSRHARLRGARLILIPGRSDVVRGLIDAGLLTDIAIEQASQPVFLEWSR